MGLLSTSPASSFDNATVATGATSATSSNSVTLAFSPVGQKTVYSLKLNGSFDASFNIQYLTSAFYITPDGSVFNFYFTFLQPSKAFDLTTSVVRSDRLWEVLLAGDDRLTLGGLDDNVSLFAGDDYVDAGAGNDRITGGAGNDVLNGGAGIDTAVFSGNRANFSLAPSGGNYEVTDRSGNEGTDTLANVERLNFSDAKVAIDLTSGGNAAKTAQFLGLLGFSFLSQKDVVGTVLGVFDQTGISLSDAFNLVLNSGLVNELAGGASDTAFVKLIHRNLVGTEASDAVAASLATQLLKDSGGAYSRIDLLNLGAELDANLQHVGLVGTTGLLATGLEYF